MVTYGTAPAPYLASRCLQQIAEDESKNFSLAPETLTISMWRMLCVEPTT